MKKYLLSCLLLVLLIPATAGTPNLLNQSVRIVIDPRIELIGMVQLLNDYMLVTQYDSIYKLDARSYFSRYKDHAAVKMFQEMSGKSFNFDAVPRTMAYLSYPPDLNVQAPFSDYVIRRAGGKDKLDEFISALRDLARKSNFMSFHDAHQGTFDKTLDKNRAPVEKAVEVLSDYSGMQIKGGTVVLGMLIHHGGFAATIEHKNGEVETYAFIGPSGVENGLPNFGSASRIAELVSHEFSHTFVNPTTEKYSDEINKYSSLYAPIAEQMKQQAYPEWHIAVNEHIVRAITSRLAFLKEGDEAGEKALKNEEERGFKYVRALAERLKEYEASRERYKTLAEFYPRLIDVFKEAAEE